MLDFVTLRQLISYTVLLFPRKRGRRAQDPQRSLDWSICNPQNQYFCKLDQLHIAADRAHFSKV